MQQHRVCREKEREHTEKKRGRRVKREIGCTGSKSVGAVKEGRSE